MKVIKVFIIFLCLASLKAKKKLPKRSTIVQRHGDYGNNEKILVTNENSFNYAHKLPKNLRIRAAEELLFMFGLKVY